MKKIKLFFSILICCFSMCVFALSAGAQNHCDSIDIDIILMENGDIAVEQIWQGSFNEGTECYIDFYTENGRMGISDFTVEMNGQKYKTLDYWDVNSSFSSKKYKCGLNSVSDGVELCWGISDYGENTYKISYTVTNALVAYNNSDALTLELISGSFNLFPTDVTATVSMWDGSAITDEICNIWTAGYTGESAFEMGKIEIRSAESLQSGNFLEILLEFEKGIFSPAFSLGEDFSGVLDLFFSGSEFDEDFSGIFDLFSSDGESGEYNITDFYSSNIEFYIILSVFSIFVAVFIGTGIYDLVRKLKLRKIKKTSEYYREAPLDELNSAYAMLKGCKECDESAIIGARLLKLTMTGCIEAVENENESLLNRGKTSFKIKDVNTEELDPYDAALYEILKRSAGKDSLLEPIEMKLYCNDNPAVLVRFLTKCEKNGVEKLDEKNCSTSTGKYISEFEEAPIRQTKYSNIFKYTPEGIAELKKYFGLKKYLEDFTLIDEKQIADTAIWQNLIIYASLFGIADKVCEDLKRMYPSVIREIEVYQRDVVFTTACRTHMYSSMTRSISRNMNSGNAARFGGSGGASIRTGGSRGFGGMRGGGTR